MKQTLLQAITVVIIIIMMSSCAVVEMTRTDGKATLLVTMDAERGWIVSEYTVTATRTGSEPVVVTSSDSTVSMVLELGTWDIYVTGKDENGITIYQGGNTANLLSSGAQITVGLIKEAGLLKVQVSQLPSYSVGPFEPGAINKIVLTAGKTGFSDVITEISDFNQVAYLSGLAGGDWDIIMEGKASNIDPQTYEVTTGYTTYISGSFSYSVVPGEMQFTSEAMTTQEKVTPVQFSHESGIVSLSDQVVLTCDTAATIRYSTDGSVPTTTYTGPFSLPVGTYTVKASASAIGMTDSIIGERSYTFQEEGYHIHFKNRGGWGTPYIYAWVDGPTELFGTWPGSAMTEEGNDWYKVLIEGHSDINLIFSNNGASQTGNLTRSEEGYYYTDDIWYSGNPEGATTTSTTTTTTTTLGGDDLNVHFKNRSGWTPYVYAWTGTVPSITEIFGAWPGKAMTDAGNDWYTETISGYSSANMIFSNNGSSQTPDLTRSNEGWYYTDDSWYDSNPEGPQAPMVGLNPGSKEFVESLTLNFSLSGDSITSSKYTTDGSDPEISGTATTFDDLDQLTIGPAMSLDETVTVRLFAENGLGTDTATYTYTKREEIAMPSFSWDNASVYFVITDRFFNGNLSNDESYGRQKDYGSPTLNTGTFHGGDLAGLTQKLNESYFQDLGTNAIWITAPYEQIHGWVGGGDNGDFPHYAYHGYYAMDYTKVDANMGTESDLQTFVDTAHTQGIRVIFDIVMNHAGYNTMYDMNEYNFGELIGDWASFDGGTSNWSGYHSLHINYDSTNWSNWWGPEWIRAGITGYDSPGGDDLTKCLDSLPDFKTESSAYVSLPPLLQNKPDTNAVFIANYTVQDYLVKWLTDWVRDYGIDGFRVDTAKHVELSAWQNLKNEANAALVEWRSNNPAKAFPDSDYPDTSAPFWMTGEHWGHGAGRSSYFDNGFDSMINFDFEGSVAGALSNYSNIDGTYENYDNSINSDDSFNLLSYLSSHDTGIFYSDRAGSNIENQKKAGTLLLLSPGGVQVFYGDENGRARGPAVSDPDQSTRSDYVWGANADLLAHWQKIGKFRNNHIAVGAGEHTMISSTPYTFSRVKENDTVVCVLGASGSTTVDVSSVFSNGTALRDAYSGATATVSSGSVSFTADTNGIILIEEDK
jgi:glycosidase